MPPKKQALQKWFHNPNLGHLLAAVLRDSLVWLSLGIAGLFTIETLLPGFVTLRFNLAYPLFLQAAIFLALLVVIDRFQVTFPASTRLNRFILMLGGLWFVAILFISLLKFSLLAKILTIATTLFILWLLWQEYLAPKK